MNKRTGNAKYGEDNHNCVLTDEQVKEITNSKKSGKDLAWEYGVSTSQISKIRNGKSRICKRQLKIILRSI